MKTRLLPFPLAAFLTLSAPAFSEGIQLTIEGVRNNAGNVLVLVFDNAKDYEALNYWNAVGYAEISAQTGIVRHNFSALNEGPYAVFLFHDENGDEDLNTRGNHLLEGVGGSGAPNREDDPNFSQASVLPGKVTVGVHYRK